MWEEAGKPRGNPHLERTWKVHKKQIHAADVMVATPFIHDKPRQGSSSRYKAQYSRWTSAQYHYGPSENPPLIGNSSRPGYCWGSYDLASEAPSTWLVLIHQRVPCVQPNVRRLLRLLLNLQRWCADFQKVTERRDSCSKKAKQKKWSTIDCISD